MANPTQYEFSLKEAAEILLKASNIKEGKWSIGVGFGVSVGNFGPKGEEVKPTVMTIVEGLQVTRVKDGDPDNGLVIDASKL